MFTMGPPLRSGASGDQYAGDVVALLHFNEPNNTDLPTSSLGSPTITNSNTSNHKVTTGQSKFGSGSWNVATGENTGLSVEAVIPLGSDDYTLEFFYRATNYSAIYGRVFAVAAASPGNIMALSILDGEFRVVDSAGSNNITAAFIPLNTWLHFAVCRSGGFTYVYVEGALAFTSAAIGAGLTGDTVDIGLGASVGMSGSDGVGQFDEFRWTRFVARYPGGFNFTPPTAEFPNS